MRETDADVPTLEGVVARRVLGLTCLYQGDFTKGHALLDEAAKLHDPERDRAARELFGMDAGITATAYLSKASWLIGNAASARELIEIAEKCALDAGHVQTLVMATAYKTFLNLLRGDAASALRSAEALGELSQKYGMQSYSTFAALLHGWASSRLGHREGGLAELRGTLPPYSELGNRLFTPLFQGLIAEIEAEGRKHRGGDCRHRRRAGARGRDGRTLDRRPPAPHPRRDFAEARSG